MRANIRDTVMLKVLLYNEEVLFYRIELIFEYDFWYSEGVKPVDFLNAVKKVDFELNPLS